MHLQGAMTHAHQVHPQIVLPMNSVMHPRDVTVKLHRPSHRVMTHLVHSTVDHPSKMHQRLVLTHVHPVLVPTARQVRHVMQILLVQIRMDSFAGPVLSMPVHRVTLPALLVWIQHVPLVCHVMKQSLVRIGKSTRHPLPLLWCLLLRMGPSTVGIHLRTQQVHVPSLVHLD
jgi:hypothetical protein